MTADLVEQLLNDRSYHIEFNGHLTNHAKHAVVALAGLGASPERIKAYYDNYAKLTPYGYGLEPPRPSADVISTETWAHLLGQRRAFSSYCEFFEGEVERLGLDDTVRLYLPRLLPGWVGAFTHATIHLGWALDAGNRWMAVEGLAYLAYSFVSCHPERAVPAAPDQPAEPEPVDSLLRVAGVWEREHDALRRWALDCVADPAAGVAAGIHPELARSGLQYRIARVLAVGHPLLYQEPTWLTESDVDDCWEELYYVVALLYLAVPGDFILLHLITSLYAMEQIANLLPVARRRDVVRCFWIGALGVVFSGADFPTRTKLAALHATFRDAVDPGGEDVWGTDWRQIIARAFEEDEEHNPKLVYVMRRLWQRGGGRTIYRAAAGQFTATPELPASFEEPPTE